MELTDSFSAQFRYQLWWVNFRTIFLTKWKLSIFFGYFFLIVYQLHFNRVHAILILIYWSLLQGQRWVHISWKLLHLWRSWSFSKVVRQLRFCPDTKVPLLETNDLSMLAGILLRDSQFRSCWKFANQACSNYIFHRMKPECIKTNYLTPRVASLVLDKIHFDSIHLEPAPCSHSHTCR